MSNSVVPPPIEEEFYRLPSTVRNNSIIEKIMDTIEIDVGLDVSTEDNINYIITWE